MMSLEDVRIPEDCQKEDLSDAKSQQELRAQLEVLLP